MRLQCRMNWLFCFFLYPIDFSQLHVIFFFFWCRKNFKEAHSSSCTVRKINSIKKVPEIDYSKSPPKEIVKNLFDAILAQSQMEFRVRNRLGMKRVAVRLVPKDRLTRLSLWTNFWQKTQRISSNNHRIRLIWLRPTFFSFKNSNYYMRHPFSVDTRHKREFAARTGVYSGKFLLKMFWWLDYSLA